MKQTKWGMVVDLDKCNGCQACVVACQSENNIPLQKKSDYDENRIIQWIRVERYWEGTFPDVKARFIPIMCQHCDEAPCEPVCPVYASYHNEEGLNVQGDGRAKLVGIAVIPLTNNKLLDCFLGLPNEALAELKCEIN